MIRESYSKPRSTFCSVFNLLNIKVILNINKTSFSFRTQDLSKAPTVILSMKLHHLKRNPIVQVRYICPLYPPSPPE